MDELKDHWADLVQICVIHEKAQINQRTGVTWGTLLKFSDKRI